MTDLPPRAPLSILQVVARVGSGGEFGGPVSVAEAQTRELSARGHRVVVTGLRRGPDRVPRGLTPDQWRTFPAWRIVPGTGMLGLSNARLLWSLWTAAGAADLVHIHTGRDLVSLSALLVARLRRVPVVAQTHGMVLPRRHLKARLFDPVFLRLVRGAGRVLYMTDGEHRDLRAQLGPAARLSFLGNGIELPDTLPTRSGDVTRGTPRVLFLARLHPVKGVLAFAEMAALLVARDVSAQCVVYGPDQGDLQPLLEFIAQRRLGDRLRYGGALDHEAAVAALSAADVYVLPSSADWMPMSLIEALAAGVPSVCTEASGLAEVLADRHAAIVTDGTPQALAAAVQRLLQDPDQAAAMAERARRVVLERFAIGAVVDELERLYAGVCSPAETNATTRSNPT